MGPPCCALQARCQPTWRRRRPKRACSGGPSIWTVCMPRTRGAACGSSRRRDRRRQTLQRRCGWGRWTACLPSSWRWQQRRRAARPAAAPQPPRSALGAWGQAGAWRPGACAVRQRRQRGGRHVRQPGGRQPGQPRQPVAGQATPHHPPVHGGQEGGEHRDPDAQAAG